MSTTNEIKLRIDELKEKILMLGVVSQENMEGLNEEEIKIIETNLSISLPISYKYFLMYFGKYSGRLFGDVEFHYPELLNLREECEEMIKEESIEFQLPVNSFVFSGYQGFYYSFFMNTDEIDPKVYYISETGEVTGGAQSFIELVDKILEEE